MSNQKDKITLVAVCDTSLPERTIMISNETYSRIGEDKSAMLTRYPVINDLSLIGDIKLLESESLDNETCRLSSDLASHLGVDLNSDVISVISA